MMTGRGKLQRIASADISTIGRNTQGVRIMTLDDDDSLAAVVRVPNDENGNGEEEEAEAKPVSDVAPPAVEDTADESDDSEE